MLNLSMSFEQWSKTLIIDKMLFLLVFLETHTSVHKFAPLKENVIRNTALHWIKYQYIFLIEYVRALFLAFFFFLPKEFQCTGYKHRYTVSTNQNEMPVWWVGGSWTNVLHWQWGDLCLKEKIVYTVTTCSLLPMLLSDSLKVT